jgi:transcriptional regulator with XRE-family HTH domain
MGDPRIGPLAVALRTARERAGLSQRALARKADWNFSLISRLERGERAHIPGEIELRRLDDALGGDGHLLRVAGYQNGDRPELEETLRQVIDAHITAMVDDIRKALGR